MPSDYHPWETEGITETAYWKRAYLDSRREVARLEKELESYRAMHRRVMAIANGKEAPDA